MGIQGCGSVTVSSIPDSQFLIPNHANRRRDRSFNFRASNSRFLGGAVVVNFEDGSGYCRFRFRAVFDDAVELTRPNVNVCEVGTYRYTD